MSTTRLTRLAPAKINLFLHITGRRESGYHDLQTVFQFLDYADILDFSVRDDARIVLQDPIAGVDASDDLVVRSAHALRQYTDYQGGVTIQRKKRLPIGGGLGGGSSNAATTLVALNTLWDLRLADKDLLAIALQLGADVPVFVHGRACWAEGVGEKFTEIDLPEPVYLVLAPPVQVSTAKIFGDPDLTRNCSPITIRDFLGGTGQNVFEPVVRSRYPAVDKALVWLETHAGNKPAMSGTGGCVFVRCENHEEALNLLGDTCQNKDGMLGFVARGCNRSPLFSKQ